MKPKVKLKVGPVLVLGAMLAFASAAGQTGPTAPGHGRELAQKFCATCHLFPEPDLLDKATWKNGALPLMRSRLGIDQLDAVNPQQKPVLDEWMAITNYYLETAPEKALPQAP